MEKIEINSVKSCFFCQKIESENETLKKCSSCKEALYCSRNCQTKDWKKHKIICKRFKVSKEVDIFNKVKKESKKSFDFNIWEYFCYSVENSDLLDFLDEKSNLDCLKIKESLRGYKKDFVKAIFCIIDTFQGRLMFKYLGRFQKEIIGKIKDSVKSYYENLIEKGYVKDFGKKYLECNQITKKGIKNRRDIIKIAFESALDCLVYCFEKLFKLKKQKKIKVEELKKILEDSDFNKLFQYRKHEFLKAIGDNLDYKKDFIDFLKEKKYIFVKEIIKVKKGKEKSYPLIEEIFCIRESKRYKKTVEMEVLKINEDIEISKEELIKIALKF